MTIVAQMFYFIKQEPAMSGQGGRLPTLTTGSVQDLSYTYDKAGNITQIVDAHGSETQTYAYDSLGRLSDWTLTGGIAESYIYDPTSGNLARPPLPFGHLPQMRQSSRAANLGE